MPPSPVTTVPHVPLAVNPVITRVRMEPNVNPIPPIIAVKATPNAQKEPVPLFHVQAERAFIHAAQVIPIMARSAVPIFQMLPSPKPTTTHVPLHVAATITKRLMVPAVKSIPPTIAVQAIPNVIPNLVPPLPAPPTAHVPIHAHPVIQTTVKFVVPMSQMVPSPKIAVIPVHSAVTATIIKRLMVPAVKSIPSMTAVQATPNAIQDQEPLQHAPQADHANIPVSPAIPAMAKFVVRMSQMVPSPITAVIPVHSAVTTTIIKTQPVLGVKSTAPVIAVPHMPSVMSHTPATAARLPVPVHSPATAVM